jgi:hypothetical protein
MGKVHRDAAIAKLKDATIKGKYPITDQHSADSAWKLRHNSTTVSPAEVVAHIKERVAALGLTMPKNKD